MNNSILFVGSDEFFNTFIDQICTQAAFKIELAVNVNEARSWLELRPPQVLIVQASLDGGLDLCRWLKQQPQLMWIYCILIEDRHQTTVGSQVAWSYDSVTAALEESADAYVWLQDQEVISDRQLTPSYRLLLAQIHVGLRLVKKYRDLLQTNQRLTGLALVDPLTKLNNRRALEWDLPLQIRSSRSSETGLSLIMLDVDYFKSVNDTYGHLVGDRVLQLLCARLRHSLRFHDAAFRYGGEEFVILLPSTECQEALLVARRLNRLISEQAFTIDNKLNLEITISLGTACLKTSDDAEGVNLIARADRYLLAAKAAGRNCAIGCEEQTCDTSEVGAVCS